MQISPTSNFSIAQNQNKKTSFKGAKELQFFEKTFERIPQLTQALSENLSRKSGSEFSVNTYFLDCFARLQREFQHMPGYKLSLDAKFKQRISFKDWAGDKVDIVFDNSTLGNEKLSYTETQYGVKNGGGMFKKAKKIVGYFHDIIIGKEVGSQNYKHLGLSETGYSYESFQLDRGSREFVKNWEQKAD